eukprot:gene10997-3309_t
MRIVLLLLTLCTLVCANKPNIIFYLADDMGFGEMQRIRKLVGLNGTAIQTPNLDQFGEEGVTFTEAYAGEAVCAPSRCTLITGKHTGHCTVRGNKPHYKGHDWPLSKHDPSVASELKKLGYKTGLVGKWGLGMNGTTGYPLNKGFDYYMGQLDQSVCHDMYPNQLWEMENHLNYPGNTNASREKCMAQGNSCTYTIDEFYNFGEQFVSTHAKKPDPFFLFLSYTVPHAGGWNNDAEAGQPVPQNGQYSKETWPDVEKDHASDITYY